jgi:hypothetical protein
MTVANLTSQNQPVFARHETFHPRYGWLRKAVDGASRDADLFSRPEAPVELGVGKNMVSAIRYWGLAFKLLEEAPNPSRPRLPSLVPSASGRALMDDAGWDPYVEAPGTLWLLHWWLLRPMTMAPVWWITFNSFPAVHFSDSALHRFVVEAIDTAAGWTEVIESSVKKDVDCLIRMYAPKRAEQSVDDLIDCPFRDLRLIEAVPGENRTYRFAFGSKPSLPDAIVAYATLDFMARTDGAATMSIARLAQDVGSPGRAFRLGEAHIFDALSRVAATSQWIRVAEPAGLKQVLVDGEPGVIAIRTLEDYFHRATGSSYRVIPKSWQRAVHAEESGRRRGPELDRHVLKPVEEVAARLSNSRDPVEEAVRLASPPKTTRRKLAVAHANA